MYTHNEDGSTYTASTRDEMVTHIEELLGSGGTRRLAEAMYGLLRDSNYITFDGRFVMESMTDRDWMEIMVKAEDSL